MLDLPTKKKVVVGMSGGVDSSVAALLLKQQGYDVIGVMMKLADAPVGQVQKHVSCCSIEDASDARRVAEHLAIPFYVLNAKQEFKKNVIDSFVQEYLSGKTPNPCVRCNDKIKFEYFYQKAKDLGADYIATGHYVKKDYHEASGRWILKKAADLKKDQSYFLFTMTQEEIAKTLFPLADFTKERVREIALQQGIRTHDKKESQEICFVADNDHGGFIDRFYPTKTLPRGNFVNNRGEVLGTHEGIHYYTIGQRRGTGVAMGEKVYVQKINPQTHQITLATQDALWSKELLIQDVRWMRQPESGSRIQVKIRYRHDGAEAQVNFLENNQVRIEFIEPQRAITPGQAAVFYDGDMLLGGGWII